MGRKLREHAAGLQPQNCNIHTNKMKQNNKTFIWTKFHTGLLLPLKSRSFPWKGNLDKPMLLCRQRCSESFNKRKLTMRRKRRVILCTERQNTQTGRPQLHMDTPLAVLPCRIFCRAPCLWQGPTAKGCKVIWGKLRDEKDKKNSPAQLLWGRRGEVLVWLLRIVTVELRKLFM